MHYHIKNTLPNEDVRITWSIINGAFGNAAAAAAVFPKILKIFFY
jgi:hypothetical protein